MDFDIELPIKEDEASSNSLVYINKEDTIKVEEQEKKKDEELLQEGKENECGFIDSAQAEDDRKQQQQQHGEDDVDVLYITGKQPTLDHLMSASDASSSSTPTKHHDVKTKCKYSCPKPKKVSQLGANPWLTIVEAVEKVLADYDQLQFQPKNRNAIVQMRVQLRKLTRLTWLGLDAEDEVKLPKDVIDPPDGLVDFDLVFCSVCKSYETSGRLGDIVICDHDMCGKAFHFRCQQPPLRKSKDLEDPEEDFYCRRCTCLFAVLNLINDKFKTDFNTCEDVFPDVADISDHVSWEHIEKEAIALFEAYAEDKESTKKTKKRERSSERKQSSAATANPKASSSNNSDLWNRNAKAQKQSPNQKRDLSKESEKQAAKLLFDLSFNPAFITPFTSPEPSSAITTCANHLAENHNRYDPNFSRSPAIDSITKLKGSKFIPTNENFISPARTIYPAVKEPLGAVDIFGNTKLNSDDSIIVRPSSKRRWVLKQSLSQKDQYTDDDNDGDTGSSSEFDFPASSSNY